jgi:hypothetical protein
MPEHRHRGTTRFGRLAKIAVRAPRIPGDLDPSFRTRPISAGHLDATPCPLCTLKRTHLKPCSWATQLTSLSKHIINDWDNGESKKDDSQRNG